ncbi:MULTISPECIES: SDR family NAD(P)-dependent oxidoreductase [Streptomyces]|uniref:SDR family NAD(P)-dependent oxidoreductase n=1 Tax=Streptomyces TaxID=1883 RepID=UPI0005CA8853|nr:MULTISPECIES: SDR family oxidoreductase [Streptomyces]
MKGTPLSSTSGLSGLKAVIDLDPPGAPEPLIAIRADLTDDTSVRTAVDATAGQLGGLDIPVNNAGIGAGGTVEDNPDAEWHRVLDVNVLGTVRTTRAALPYLRRSSHAAIVNTCSIASAAGLPRRALYPVGKGAVLSLTLATAADRVREGIRVDCVNPGTADTPWGTWLLDTADEVAAAVVHLASPAAASVTGIALAVDGAMRGLRPRPAVGA